MTQAQNVSDENYRTTQQCDCCNTVSEGTMHHAPDAMGWATPVLFMCDRCENPTVWMEVKRRSFRALVLAKFYWRMATSKQERERRAAMKAKFARIKAKRSVGAEIWTGS